MGDSQVTGDSLTLKFSQAFLYGAANFSQIIVCFEKVGMLTNPTQMYNFTKTIKQNIVSDIKFTYLLSIINNYLGSFVEVRVTRIRVCTCTVIKRIRISTVPFTYYIPPTYTIQTYEITNSY